MLFPMKKYMNAVSVTFLFIYFWKEMDIINFLGKFSSLIIRGKIKIHYILILFMYFYIKYPYLLMIFFSYCISIWYVYIYTCYIYEAESYFFFPIF